MCLCRAIPFVLGCLLLTSQLPAQTPAPKPEPDVLIFTNGDKLVGHFEGSTGGTITFKSDMLGDVHVDWSKVKELRSSTKFAVIRKGVKIRHKDESGVPQGPVAVADQKIEVAATPPQSVPVGDAAYVVDQAAFNKAVMQSPGFFKSWTGTVTAGASLVEATQDSRTFTGAINLVRAVPSEQWLNPSSRTTVNFTASYGTISQPSTPTIKTSIYHGDAEQDKYFTPRVFAFGQAAFDHNFSQGLQLQQTYGGGIGWSVLKSANQTLDLKASTIYIDQQFEAISTSQSLIGSTFAEIYMRKLLHGMIFNEKLSATPAWNNSNAYSWVASAGLTVPVVNRFSANLNIIDSFLNDPPQGFKKNSFQLTLGLTYALQ
jgi:hypothetical protein